MRTPVFYWTPRTSPADHRLLDRGRTEPDRDRRPSAPRSIVKTPKPLPS